MKLAGGLPVVSYSPSAAALTVWPSPWASTELKLPEHGDMQARWSGCGQRGGGNGKRCQRCGKRCEKPCSPAHRAAD